jgi:hypothetical protein
MRKAHELSDEYEDAATTSLLDNFINETERASGLSSKLPAKQETTLKEHVITGRYRPCRNISSI